MLWFAAVVGIASASAGVPVYDAAPYTTVVRTHKNGILQMVNAPDAQPLPVIHVYGNAQERGEAYGTLLADEIETFMTTVIDDNVALLLQLVDLSKLPEWLVHLVTKAVATLGPRVVQAALGWVHWKEQKYTHAANDKVTFVFEELTSMADAVCTTIGPDRCRKLGGAKAFADRMVRVNYLPELLQMHCSMLGATGSATTHGKLVQMRTLVFGTVPFANYSLVAVHHQTDNPNAPAAFAMVSFPGFAAAVTSLNSAGLVQSERVTGTPEAWGTNSTAGNYNGEGGVWMIRRIIQMASNRKAAIEMVKAAKRTWHFELGFGDSETQGFNAVGLSYDSLKVWDDADIGSLTGSPRIDNVTFIGYPSQQRMYDTLRPIGDHLSGHLVASTVPHMVRTGDVHSMVADHGEGKVYVAVGTVTADSSRYIRMACDAPAVSFEMSALWSLPRPSSGVVV